jgi:hypothetical protein
MTSSQREFLFDQIQSELSKRGREGTAVEWVLSICLDELPGKKLLQDMAANAVVQADAAINALESNKLQALQKLSEFRDMGKAVGDELKK